MIESRHGAYDQWLALLAGDAVWQEGDCQPRVRERAVAGFMLVVLAGTILTQWVALAGRSDFLYYAPWGDINHGLFFAAHTSVLAAAALASRPARLLVGRPTRHASYAWSLAWRAVAYFALIAGTAAALPRARWIAAMPLGLVGGADAVLTLWVLGIKPRVRAWISRFFFSTLHFGALGALSALFVSHSLDGVDRRTLTLVLGAYVAMWTGIAVAGVSIVAIDRLCEVADREHDAERREIVAKERSQRAHWLHDDVLSEVRYTTMRVDAERTDIRSIRRELEDLDHRLRLRQLDEFVRGGNAHLYAILQPHLRRLQTLGVTVARVPPLEVTGLRVDESTAALLNRTLGVLTSNAVNAGATEILLSLHVHDDPIHGHIELRVVDDAGGFDFSAIPEGRGLHALGYDLGSGGLDREPVEGGSRMVARVPLTNGQPSSS